jgi:hypothetical protein
MYRLLEIKFRQHPELAEQLLATGERELVEGNTWRDRIWGVDLKTGTGENRLGKTLMVVRAELRARARARKELGREICAAYAEEGLNRGYGCGKTPGHRGAHGEA